MSRPDCFHKHMCLYCCVWFSVQVVMSCCELYKGLFALKRVMFRIEFDPLQKYVFSCGLRRPRCLNKVPRVPKHSIVQIRLVAKCLNARVPKYQSSPSTQMSECRKCPDMSVPYVPECLPSAQVLLSPLRVPKCLSALQVP